MITMMCPMTGAGTGTMWWMMGFMGVSGLLFLAVLGWGIYLVARNLRQDDAEMVLRRRLALGEITETEFDARRAVLKR